MKEEWVTPGERALGENGWAQKKGPRHPSLRHWPRVESFFVPACFIGSGSF